MCLSVKTTTTRIGVFAQVKGKYCVYPQMVYRLAIVMPPPPPYFGWPKMNFDRISRHFRSILDIFHKMAVSGHFGWPKITFDRISRHFRSIRNFFFTKWLPAAILDDRKSHLIAFLAISDQYATFIFLFTRWLPRMTENRFRSHFSPFQINTQLFFRWIYDRVREPTSFLSIFIQNGRQRSFCFSDWCQKSQATCNLGPQWLWRIWIWLVYWWQSYGLYKRWRAAAAETQP